MSETPRTGTSNTTASSKKRKYFDRGAGKGNRRKWSILTRPKRGAPGVLLTCETGRENKCQREGLEILNHYHSTSARRNGKDSEDKREGREDDNDDDDDDTTKPLSLEEELSLLKSKKGGSSESSAFGVYDTNCRGTIFVLCTLPKCNLIEAIQTEYMRSKQTNNNTAPSSKSKTSEDGSKTIDPETKKSLSNNNVENPSPTKVDDDDNNNDNDDGHKKSAPDLPDPPPPWDPISTVRAIMSDIDNDCNKEAPRSRFVTRMIPIQATCFASPEELRLTCDKVLRRFVEPKRTKTFAIVFKRRNCSSLDRGKVIEIVGDAMLELFPACKVDLGAPDATIMVEICGTLCGMAVVENCKSYRKFNLMGAAPAPDPALDKKQTP
mmetsp:Transcript_3355/g.9317  ORF Transcript_3355/g.9317 Transcript_3355/m.9317 type:complete len:380 (-) Transcript_3355:311-1450(-)|eukprot:CAMPEP_0172364696 /NCGR_PEP_ID=MMETSP1060-20121228/7756_1 /TAXON_ID=37318 /ORGANISM="Pseudo-nitzschia pungens, Strain cf. cingulata" /LENGTH=379 /DNA_ID=CAMNT_0013087753 /DNA_START=147 /DNA_END=1286 /DNA_ORIENTATION=-